MKIFKIPIGKIQDTEISIKIPIEKIQIIKITIEKIQGIEIEEVEID